MAVLRAIYRNGTLELLNTVNLQDGQEVQLQIVKPVENIDDLIGDMLVQHAPDNSEIDEIAIMDALDRELAGQRPLSEIIIEERYAIE